MYIGPFFSLILFDFYCILAVTNKEMKQFLVLVHKKSLLATARRTLDCFVYLHRACIFKYDQAKMEKG